MGLFDVITGKRKLKGPAPDRLFAISTAYVAFTTEIGLTSRGSAGIIFQAVDNVDFGQIVKDMEEVLAGTSADSGTTVSNVDDSYGYRWMVLSDPDFDDLVVGLNAVGGALQAGGYGERILAAVFGFEDERKRPVYFIYNYKRGTFYPFAPKPGSSEQRDNERELRLKAQVGAELPMEAELERWFPLWGAPL